MRVFRITEEELQAMLDKAADYAASMNTAAMRAAVAQVLKEYYGDRLTWVDKKMKDEAGGRSLFKGLRWVLLKFIGQ